MARTRPAKARGVTLGGDRGGQANRRVRQAGHEARRRAPALRLCPRRCGRPVEREGGLSRQRRRFSPMSDTSTLASSKFPGPDGSVTKFRTNPRATSPSELVAWYRGTCHMGQREDRFRAMAAQCLGIANTTTDWTARATLLMMAQSWLEMSAERLGDRLVNALIDDFNQRQMVEPLRSQPRAGGSGSTPQARNGDL
jgi:hypothetical protein